MHLKEAEPVCGRETERRILHRTLQCLLSTELHRLGAEVVDHPVANMVEGSEIIRERSCLLETEIGDDAFGENQHPACTRIDSGKPVSALDTVSQVDFHTLQPAPRCLAPKQTLFVFDEVRIVGFHPRSDAGRFMRYGRVS